MRKTIIWFLALIVFCLLSPFAMAQDKWIAEDKAYHLIAGTAIAGAGTFAFKDARAGFALGCGVGVLKEVYDKQHPDIHTASWKDAAVTCLGAGIGAYGMQWMLTRQQGTTTISYLRTF